LQSRWQIDFRALLHQYRRMRMTMNSNNTTASPRIEELSEHIKDYLRGYGRPDGKRLSPLVSYDAWRFAASVEIMARCTRILSLLDDESLALIAHGEISLAALASDVASELAGQTASFAAQKEAV